MALEVIFTMDIFFHLLISPIAHDVNWSTGQLFATSQSRRHARGMNDPLLHDKYGIGTVFFLWDKQCIELQYPVLINDETIHINIGRQC